MTKNKKTKNPEKELYYVGIQEPVEIRRSLLESSRELLQFLQRYEKFKAVRNEKRESVALLKAQMRDVSSLLNDLKKVLPTTTLRAQDRNETPKISKKKEEPVKIIIPPAPTIPQEHPDDDVDKLQKELNDIENKLNTLF